MTILYLFLLLAGVISTELFPMGGVSSAIGAASLSVSISQAEARERQKIETAVKRIQQDLSNWVTIEREKIPHVEAYSDEEIGTIIHSLFDYGMTLVDQEKKSTQETALKKNERYRTLLEETRQGECSEYCSHFSARLYPLLTRLNTIDPYCVRFFDVCTHKHAQLGTYKTHIQQYLKKHVLLSVRKAHQPCCCCCSIL